jgi:hypothetical protein
MDIASGTLIHGIQGIDYDTFYINGRAPPYSTPKPVRFIVVKKDEGLNKVPIEELTWDLSHDYPNWTGPIKVPSVCQMAHKLAELGGSFADCGTKKYDPFLINGIRRRNLNYCGCIFVKADDLRHRIFTCSGLSYHS